MSEGSSGAAPSGVSTPAPAAPSGDAAKSTAPQAKTDAKPSWTEDDDKAFFELAKKSPYRAKIKGEERAIDSKQSLQDLLNHAQRGIGANKVVEQARKDAEEAKRLKAEAEHERQLIQRARSGDFEARKALGMVSMDELRRRDAEWEAVPPEVRQLYEEHTKAQQELLTLKKEREEREAETMRRREESEMGAARRVAADTTKRVSDAFGITMENAERYLPFVAGAIADLSEEGLELGVDMTDELIIDRVKARIGSFDEQHFSSIAPDRALTHVLPTLSKSSDEQLLQLLPEELQRRVSKLYAAKVRGQRTQQASPVQRQQEERRPEPPKVLSPFRFRGL